MTSQAIWREDVAGEKIARDTSGHGERMSWAKESLVTSPAIWRAHVASEELARVNGSERSRVEEFPSEKIARDVGLYNLMGMGASEKIAPAPGANCRCQSR